MTRVVPERELVISHGTHVASRQRHAAGSPEPVRVGARVPHCYAVTRSWVTMVLTLTLAPSACLAQATKEPPWLGAAAIFVKPTRAGEWTKIPGENQLLVFPNGPAARAGLKSGDLLLAIGGEAVTIDTALPDVLGRYAAGDKVEVVVAQAGIKYKAQVILEARPARGGHAPVSSIGRAR